MAFLSRGQSCDRLWDSWEPHALILDRQQGIYADPDKVHYVCHEGRHFKARGGPGCRLANVDPNDRFGSRSGHQDDPQSQSRKHPLPRLVEELDPGAVETQCHQEIPPADAVWLKFESGVFPGFDGPNQRSREPSEAKTPASN